MNMKTLLPALALASVSQLFADSPTVTVTSTVQDPASRKVTVDYTLAGAAGIVTCFVETNSGNGTWIEVEDLKCMTHLAGDVNVLVEPGSRSFTWRPEKDWAGHEITDNSLRIGVRAWDRSAPPPYLVVDIASGAKTYYPCAEAIPLGVTNSLYKTAKLVMRLIPAGGVAASLGSAPNDGAYSGTRVVAHEVAFAEDYWIGIYELTQGQVYRMSGHTTKFDSGLADSAIRPMQNVSTDSIRGKTAGNNWPNANKATAHDVDSGTVLGGLRYMTGIDFDLPTEAQWEFAARAGKDTALPNGGTDSDAGLNPIAWTARNADDHTHPVGLLEPNAWGLYDVIGNVEEFCLDWFDSAYPQTLKDMGRVTDPEGPATPGSGSTGMHVVKGGSWQASHPHLATRAGWAKDRESSGEGKRGARVMAPLLLKW